MFTFIGIYISLNFIKETIAISATLEAIINKVLKIARKHNKEVHYFNKKGIA